MPVRYQNSSLPFVRQGAPKSIDLGSSVPRHLLPISPPETDRTTPSIVTDPRQLHSQTPSQSFPDGLQVTPPTATGESPSRYRRNGSISYIQSGLQPRASPVHNRPSRWLIVVMPPSSLNSEPALGHTLATSPPGRFQSGILMPLFPTLYGQLAAISKEFSLPSTTGVCIYLHVNDHGLNMAPRISDEAWQLLWGHYFIPDEGAPAYPPHQLPICGQIEFDVDIRKARWYESWVSGHVRHPSLEAAIPPSVAHSLSKWYNDATGHRDEEAEAHQDDSASIRGKHIPRPLALGRREGSVRSMHKYKAVNGRDGDAESTISRLPPHKLSPVMQAEEPATAKQNLDILVRNWRLQTPAVPTLPRDEGTLKDTLESPALDIDLDDFQWSISSAGPPWHPGNGDSTAYQRSIHLGERVEGSVLLTPSVATSFGPDDLPTPTFSNVSRYPSPDVAARFREDAPLSPVTVTSWGAPLSWPTTPASVERVLSPDLGARAIHSRPDTPMTATSWGAPEHWPASPFEFFRPHTPDAGHRGQHTRPATPSTATSWGAPEHWPASPFEHTRPHTPDYAHRMYDEAHPVVWNHAKPWAHVWPYTVIRKEKEEQEVRAKLEGNNGTFRFVWPFMGNGKASGEPANVGGSTTQNTQCRQNEADPYKLVWPFFGTSSGAQQSEADPYKLVWPFFETSSRAQEHTKSKAEPYKLVWPFYGTSAAPPSPQSVVAPSTYPFLQIYRPVYPHVNVYAPESADEIEVRKCQSVRLYNVRAYDYPKLVIYPSKYGEDDGEEHWRAKGMDVKATAKYPNFDLYPAVYPNVCPYPESGILDNLKMKSTSLGKEAPEYPAFDIYNTGVAIRPPPAPRSVRLQTAYPGITLYETVYPSLSIYPAVETIILKAQAVLLPTSIYEYPVIGIYGPAAVQEVTEPESVVLTSCYGRLNLYPAAYPHIEPYPACDAVELKNKPVLLRTSKYRYPLIGIYGPASQLAIASQVPASRGIAPQVHIAKPCIASLPSAYGRLNLYPSCYPYLDIYPNADPVESKKQPVLFSSHSYDYPSLSIYPGSHSGLSTLPKEQSVTLPSSYGRLNLYPAAYPPEPYPPTDAVELKTHSVLRTSYNYPAIVIYPGCSPTVLTVIPTEQSTRLPIVYPFFDLYPAAYPYSVEPYPSTQVEKREPITPEFHYPDVVIYAPVHELIRPAHINVKLSRTQGYPSFELYEQGYPIVCPYPVVSGPANHMPLELPKLRSVKVNIDRYVSYPTVEPYTPAAILPTPLSVRLLALYPAFDIYPTTGTIYPPIEPAAACQKVSPLLHDGYMYPNIIIYRPLDRSHKHHISFVKAAVIHEHRSHAKSKKRRTGSKGSWDHLPPVPPLPSHILNERSSPRVSLNLLESYKVVEPLSERRKDVLSPHEPTISVKKPRKTHIQLYIEVFQSMRLGNPQQAHSDALSILSPNPHPIKRRKTHQQLWSEVFPNGPQQDIAPALSSPVSELPAFNRTSRLGRARSGSVAQTQPIATSSGISRASSLRSSQPHPNTPAPPVPTTTRMRAMSRATIHPTVEAEPSTRIKRLSNSFLSHRPVEERADDKENAAATTPPSGRRPSQTFTPPLQRSGSLVQRTAHMLTHQDEKHSPEPATTGARLSRTPSKLDRSKFPFA